MKKILLFILLPILAIIIAIFVIFFTPFGSNSVIKPVINSKIKEKIKKPRIEITRLDSKFGYIDLDAISDNGIKANAKGEVNYFSKKFDLNYNLNAKSVKVEDKDIKVDLDINGQAVGGVKNFGVNGEGKAFDSDIKYKFIIKNKNPESIVASVNSAQIAKIFATLNQVPVVDGLLFVNANMPSLDIKNPNGRANIEVREGRFNRGYIAKEYKIKIPQDEKYIAKFKAAVANNYIIGKGDLNTTTAKIKLKKLTTSLDFKQAKGYYNLNIDNLSRLSTIAKTKLQGKLALEGVFYANAPKRVYQISATTKSLGGKLGLKYNTNNINVNLNSVSVVKILKMLAQPYYVTSGTVDGVVNIANIAHLNGNFAISAKGVLNKKLLKVKLPSYKYSLKAKGLLKDSILSVNSANLFTNFIDLKLQKLKYSLLTNSTVGSYRLNIDNLQALNTFTKQNFRGKFNATGAFDYRLKELKANLTTKSFNGITKVKINGDRLVSQFRDISLEKLLYILNQPQIIKAAKASGDLDILSIKKQNGKFTIKSMGSLDTNSINSLYNIDLGKIFKYSMLIKNGVIKDGRVLTKPTINTSYGSANFDYLNYDINSKTLSAKYSIKIDELKRLKPLIKEDLSGSFALNGDIKQNPSQLLITGVANEFGGVINFMLENDNIKITAAGLSVVKVLKMLNYEQVLDGVAKVDLKYNKKSKIGNFTVVLNEARFLNSKLVETLKESANFDLSKEVFRSATIRGTISGDIVTFSLDSSSQRVQVVIKDAQINTKEQTINARVKVVQKNQDYNFRVTGPIKDPHVKILFSGYIQKKVQKRVLKELEKSGVTKDAEKVLKKIIPNEIKALREDNKTKEQIKKIIPKEIKGLFDKLL